MDPTHLLVTGHLRIYAQDGCMLGRKALTLDTVTVGVWFSCVLWIGGGAKEKEHNDGWSCVGSICVCFWRFSEWLRDDKAVKERVWRCAEWQKPSSESWADCVRLCFEGTLVQKMSYPKPASHFLIHIRTNESVASSLTRTQKSIGHNNIHSPVTWSSLHVPCASSEQFCSALYWQRSCTLYPTKSTNWSVIQTLCLSLVFI